MELPTGVKIVCLLLSAVHASAAFGKVPRLFDLTPLSVCTAPTEIVCSTDCNQLLVCLGNGEGGYTQEVVATCPSDTLCSAEEAACVAPEASKCHPPLTDDEFICTSVGDFPDPYDCQRYHICTAKDQASSPGTCTGTTAYNPLRGDCSLTTSDRVCTEGPIAACEKLGQVGIVPENPSIYYICKQKGDDIVPELNKCPGNEVFDTDSAQCVAPALQH